MFLLLMRLTRASVLALLLAVLVPACVGAATATARKAPAGLATGVDDFAFQDPVAGPLALQRAKGARASIVRIVLTWASVAPTAPPTPAQARDPNWSGYRWEQFDAAVQGARAAGLEPDMLVLSAPAWAEGPGKPGGAVPGSWKPSASAFRDFAEAAARRYSGSIQPRVRYWQAWNEPNVEINLAPQWTLESGRNVPTAPGIYKRLLNAFYDGVKAADASNFVVTAGTAPYGSDPGTLAIDVMRPVYFWRQVLCVKGGRKPRAKSSCSGGPARFDALAHHPYPVGPPGRSAINADDAAIPDLGRLSKPLAVAVKAGYAYPKKSKQLWVTEVSYDSNPPDPKAYSQSRQALYLESTFYRLWKQGVDVVNWFLLRDDAEGRGWAFTNQSGLYTRGATIAQDQAKPALTAFRFPFTAYRRSSRKVELWGLAPQKGKVIVERKSGSSWKTVARPTARANRVFLASLTTSNGTVLRARQVGETSLSWKVRSKGP